MKAPSRLGIIAFIALSLAASVSPAHETPTNPGVVFALLVESSQRLSALQEAHPDVPGYALAVATHDGQRFAGSSGVADPAGTEMTGATPVRIASITKTFVAATVLRLWEQGRIDLDAPIGNLIGDPVTDLLESDGYDTGTITVRHLLMHAGGLADHATSDAFLNAVITEPQRVWTADEQIALLVSATDPLGAPGAAFAYSDTGYVILGRIIEAITQQPLHEAVWTLTRLDAIGFETAWWDAASTRPEDAPARAHQWMDGLDMHGVDGSADAFGGGGIVASVEDVAAFQVALFEGEVFDDPATLTLMIEAPGHPQHSPYRMGLFVEERDGRTLYHHSGFWGTDVVWDPELGIAIASVSLAQEGYRGIRELSRALLERAHAIAQSATVQNPID